MKILINYADEKFKKAQKLNTFMGKHFGKFDKVYEYGPEDIDKEYTEAHKDIFAYKRGNGLWLWKAYFIDRLLATCDEGDIIFYLDSGAFFVKSVDKLLETMRDDEKIFITDIPLIEKCFTKPLCFEKMECPIIDYGYLNQTQGGFIALKNCKEVRDFVKEWKAYAENCDLICCEGTFPPVTEMGDGFVVHREDQSILSLLIKKHNIRQHRDPSQFGRFEDNYYSPYYAYKATSHDDKYGTVVYLHRTPNVNLKRILINEYKMYREHFKFLKMLKKKGIKKKDLKNQILNV